MLIWVESSVPKCMTQTLRIMGSEKKKAPEIPNGAAWDSISSDIC